MALGARCCQLAGRCRPVHPPHRTHEAAGLGDPGKAARGAGRGGHAGPPRSPEPAVVPQPPGRSRWDPREARTLGASPKPLRRVGVGAFVVCVLPLSAVATWGHRPSLRTLCKARSRRRPPERARSGGGRPGPDKGREGGGGAERSAAWPARGRCPHPRLPLRTAQSCSRAMFLSVGAPRAPEAAARWSRPGGVASLRPHRRPPPLPSSGRSASARRAGSPTAAASRRAEESQRRTLPRRAPLKWRAPGAPAHLSSERSAACRPRGHCARAAPPSRVPRPPLASRASRAAHPSLPVSSRSLELPRSDFSIPSRRTSSSGAWKRLLSLADLGGRETPAGALEVPGWVPPASSKGCCTYWTFSNSCQAQRCLRNPHSQSSPQWAESSTPARKVKLCSSCRDRRDWMQTGSPQGHP